MPWLNIKDVPASFRHLASTAGGENKVPLTLSQANEIGRMFDGLKGNPNIDSPMAIAITNFRKMFEVKDGRWERKVKKLKEETGDRASPLSLPKSVVVDYQDIRYVYNWGETPIQSEHSVIAEE